MKEETKSAKAERLIAEAIKQRGYIFPEWELVCKNIENNMGGIHETF